MESRDAQRAYDDSRYLGLERRVAALEHDIRSVIREEIGHERELRLAREGLRWEGHSEQHRLLDRQVTLATDNLNYRLDQMNELRDQITSERGTFVQRSAYEARAEGTEKRLAAVEQGYAGLGGRDRGLGYAWLALGGLVGMAGLAVAIWK